MSMSASHFSLRKDYFSGSSAQSVGLSFLFGESAGSSFGGSVVRSVVRSAGHSFPRPAGRPFVVCSFHPSAVWSACFASSNALFAVCFSKAAF